MHLSKPIKLYRTQNETNICKFKTWFRIRESQDGMHNVATESNWGTMYEDRINLPRN